MAESITELQNLWSAILKKLKENVEDVRFFDVFLSESYIHSYNGKEMIVAVNSNLAATILTTKYLGVFQDSVKEITGSSVKITFDIAENLKTSTPKEEDKPVYFKNSVVNPNLTFDSFVTGSSNLEAKQAAMYIAARPGVGFNPLFIYSNPGLGKTHLLQGIVNFVREKLPGKKALYCEAGDFLQEFVDTASGAKQMESLKKFITAHDVLLIDDIQQLSSKDKTLSFFFEIFNRLLMQGKQVVITSDKAPSELKGFEERLKSRFASGLTVAIHQPEIPTCVAILKSKIERSPLDIEYDPKVLDFIGEKFSRNVREIDQAFNRLVFYVTSYKPTKYIDMGTAMEALQILIDVKDAKQKLSEQKIINVVADYYGKTPSQITGSSREGDITLARHVAMYLIRVKLDVPFTKIGFMFGGKDHSTVMSGVNKVEKSLKTNELLQKAVSEIEARLKS